MEDSLDYVGKRIPRKDGPEKVTGRAKYTVDMALPGMLVGRILRSPHPHARIVHVDTSRAKRLPGVRAVMTSEDTKGAKHGFVETPRYPPDQYVLATDRVRYIGEEVAAVAAIDPYVAEEAIDLIRVEYEPLPAVFDPIEAMQPDAPEIHPSHPKVKEPLANIAGKTETGWGDIERGFGESDYVREDRFESHLRTHGYMEPQATLASYEGGKLNVWTSSMGPFIKRAKLAKILGLPYSSVRVQKAYVGGAFGGKVDLFSHEYCSAFLSMQTGRPVKIVASREEIFTAYRHGQPLIIEIKTGVKKDGTLVSQQYRVINNCGGYRGSGVVVIFLAWGYMMPPYAFSYLKYEGYAVYTNNPVRAPQRGHGCPQIRYAVESQLDIIAEDIGVDPIEIRMKNARKPGDQLPNGDRLHNFGLQECIKRAAKHTDFVKKYEKNRSTRVADGPLRRGIGLGVSAYITGSLIYPNSSSVVVKMNDDGTVSLLTGALDIGQGAETILCQIVAEELKVPMDEIQITASDTETTPPDIGSWISGNAYVTGNAARIAATEVREKLFHMASQELEANVKDLKLGEKSVYVAGTPMRKLTFEQLVAASIRKRGGDPVMGEGHWRNVRNVPFHPSLASAKGRWSDSYASDAQVAEVEVNMETGQVRVVRAVTVHDCGFPINPMLVEGQVDGQVSMALGHALLEEVLMEEGRTLNPSFLDYRMPCSHDMAPSETMEVVTERYRIGQSYRTKDVGEGLVSGMIAAIANAVYNAVGVRLYSTPFTPEKILRGLGKIR